MRINPWPHIMGYNSKTEIPFRTPADNCDEQAKIPLGWDNMDPVCAGPCYKKILMALRKPVRITRKENAHAARLRIDLKEFKTLPTGFYVRANEMGDYQDVFWLIQFSDIVRDMGLKVLSFTRKYRLPDWEYALKYYLEHTKLKIMGSCTTPEDISRCKEIGLHTAVVVHATNENKEKFKVGLPDKFQVFKNKSHIVEALPCPEQGKKLQGVSFPCVQCGLCGWNGKDISIPIALLCH